MCALRCTDAQCLAAVMELLAERVRLSLVLAVFRIAADHRWFYIIVGIGVGIGVGVDVGRCRYGDICS